MSQEEPETVVSIGQTVYDDDGSDLGTVRGFTDDGFVVTTREGMDGLSIEHERSGHEFGEAELVWRCSSCGEVGTLDQFPDECPGCGADRSEVYYTIED